MVLTIEHCNDDDDGGDCDDLRQTSSLGHATKAQSQNLVCEFEIQFVLCKNIETANPNDSRDFHAKQKN